MASADADEGFRITDRRRRADDEDTLAPTAKAPDPAPVAARTIEIPGSEPQRSSARSAPPPEPMRSDVDSERSLAGLFVMLASSAAMAMGDAPDPMTGQVHRDLGQAAEIVDLLVLLREKTEGNRTAEETQILDEIVYDLQLRYVSATKRGGRPPGPPRP
jgi:hypothetical protein